MIENIDENMGRLMNKLDQWNLSKDTILIFMSDNGSVGSMVREGSKLGTSKDGEAMEGYNAGMKGSKGSPHEGGVRVPFFVRWPGKFAANQEIERISAHIDLLPTLADIAGIEKLPKGQVEGRSLVPLLKNPRAKWKDRYLYSGCSMENGIRANGSDVEWFCGQKREVSTCGKQPLRYEK